MVSKWGQYDRRYGVRWRIASGVAAGVLVLSIVTPVTQYILNEHRYALSATTRKLIGKPDAKLTKLLSYDAKKQVYQINADAKKDSGVLPAQLTESVGVPSKSTKVTYSADLPADLSKGVTYYESNTDLSFGMVPQFKAAEGRSVDGHMVYPIDGGAQAVYTPKTNGVKEDIVVPQVSDDTMKFSYDIQLPKSLEARKIPGTEVVGVYSAEKALFDNISFGSEGDRLRVEQAREKAAKNNLVFVIPAPVIKGLDGKPVKGAAAHFELKGTTLTVVAEHLSGITQPITIDPSVVVTSTTDFQLGGNNESMIDFSTSGQIGTSAISAGTTGTWTAGTTFANPRHGHGGFAYNGYLYVMGGTDNTTNFSDVQYAPINTNGTVGTWAATSSLPAVRYFLASAVYNGYAYALGGNDGTTRQNTVYYAKVNSDGTLGSWSATTSFTTGRSVLAAFAYGNYIYISGGTNDGTNMLSDVQYSAIKADGTLGTWATTTSLPTALGAHSMVGYNNYVYIVGGLTATGTGSAVSVVRYAPINSDGTIGAWTSTTSFTTARGYQGTVAYDGYLYIIAGYNGSTYYSDVQYAPINADGTVGTWATTSAVLSTKISPVAAAYNGYLYVTGGGNGSGESQTAQYSQISASTGSAAPSITSWSATASFTTARAYHATVVNSGYIYVIGGGFGSTYSNVSTQYNSVQYAKLNADGTVGTWAATTAFPTARDNISAVAANGYLYVLGGGSGLNDSTVYNNVHYAKFNSNGTVGSWTSTTAFTTARANHTSVVNSGYIYVIGGWDGNNALTDVQYAPLNASTGTVGAWTTTTSLPSGVLDHSSVVYNGYVYVLGGHTDTNWVSDNPVSTVRYAPMNANGTIGAWSTTTSLTSVRFDTTAVVYNGYIIIMGGHNNMYRLNDTDYNTVQYAQINSNGTIGSWTTATGFTTARFALTGATYNNYLYILGGHDSNSTPNYYNDVQYAALTASSTTNIAQIGIYSKLVDLGSQMDITSIVFNGTSACGTGSNIDYRVAGNTAVFGTLSTIAAADPGVTNSVSLNNVRYIWLRFTTDDSSCTGSSVITDITVNYTLGSPPAAPTTITPAYGTTGLGTQPAFTFRTTDDAGTYARYKVDICSTSNCSSIVATADQTVSQTGWSGQDAQTGTAYALSSTLTSSTIATYTYTGTLSQGTQYWWRAYAIDPDDANLWSTASSIQTFTTAGPPAAPTLISPASAATGVSKTPAFTLRTTDTTGSYVRYKIDLCSTSNCSSIVRTMDETASQTGWSGQDAQTGTAYVVSGTLASSTIATHTYQSPGLSPGTQYWWRAYAIDPGDSNTWSAASGIQSFTTVAATVPAAPTLIGPANAATGVSSSPVFTFRTTDAGNDYLRYKIDICSTSNCSSIVRTVDETASQTGWSGQDAQAATAYVGNSTLTSSTVATYTYQVPGLSSNTQYWWRAYAIDPGDSNTWSAASAINSFTTNAVQTSVRLTGGVRIVGGTRIGN